MGGGFVCKKQAAEPRPGGSQQEARGELERTCARLEAAAEQARRERARLEAAAEEARRERADLRAQVAALLQREAAREAAAAIMAGAVTHVPRPRLEVITGFG